MPNEAETPQNALALRLAGVEPWQAPSSIAQMNREQASRVIAIAENARQREPESPSVADTLARLLLLAPAEMRDPIRAQELAQFAMKKSPDDPDVINTLGLSQLRVGDVQGAIETVQNHLKLQSDTTLPFALYILAISMNRDGRIDEAKTHFDWAVRSESAAVYATEEVNADCEVIAEEARALLNEIR